MLGRCNCEVTRRRGYNDTTFLGLGYFDREKGKRRVSHGEHAAEPGYISGVPTRYVDVEEEEEEEEEEVPYIC